ncbi:nucleoside hydrolase [Pseudooctadecabacter jejudonensis]|uniref:Pyrimidine-specific ribonucleoside hydrolase RihB n=1 Tax=Pseudooctadecabacter jejudonensis TaxID=1391910 RepID=A0A1Y5RYM1_9RHOB|nr:nucleoside hydrolase [Pseudooctadecabacter jejudonensis]SLN27139.1 Pyrimidine-specific ribonucleoside hydrolase RihB [Pseudooctadecabacter jejudonensis]
MKLILDTDPGVDDAMTYFYAHAHSAIDLIGITSVFGNVTVDNAYRNAHWLTQTTGATADVRRGAETPLQITPNPPSDYVHGPTGFGDVDIGEVAIPPQDETAAAYLVRMAAASPGEITLCAIGPMTNVARAIQADPAFLDNLKQLVIMGGSLDAGGNVTTQAEANFWNDPHAAEVVFSTPTETEILVVGLDVTTLISFYQADFDELAAQSPKAGGFLRDIGQFYMRFYEEVTGTYQCYLHDVAAIIAAEQPALFTFEDTRLQMVCDGDAIGAMRRSQEPDRPIVRVAMTVQSEAVRTQYKAVAAQNP